MTADEAKKTEQILNELDTKISELQRKEREMIDGARTLNANVRLAQAEIRKFTEQSGPLRTALNEHRREEARKVAEATATIQNQPAK